MLKGNYDKGISIIVPVYNVEKYLADCFESLDEQTDNRFEVILIDDGSTDNSSLLCREWAKDREWVKFITKKNEGLGPTRNLGIGYATQKYITFLDSDDYLDKHFIEEMMSNIEDDVDIIYCDCIYVRNNGSRERDYFRTDLQRYSSGINDRMAYGYPNIWGAVYKKSLWLDNDLKMPGIIYEDTAIYCVLIYYTKKIKTCKNAMYYYRAGREDGLFVQGQKDYKLMILALERLIELSMTRNLYCELKEGLLTFCKKQMMSELLTKKSILSVDEYRTMKRDIRVFMSKYFEGWNELYDLNLCIYGSYSLCKLYNSIKLIHDDEVDKFIFFSPIYFLSTNNNNYKLSIKPSVSNYRKKIIEKYINGDIKAIFKGYDIVFMDFLEDIYDVVNINGTYLLNKKEIIESLDVNNEYVIINRDSEECYDLWKTACDKLIGHLISEKKKIFIFEHYFPKQYRNSSTDVFETLEENRKNGLLVNYYSYVKNKYPEIEFIKIPDYYMFSDRYSRVNNEYASDNYFARYISERIVIRRLLHG